MAMDVEPPLGQFQHTLFTRDDVLKLVQTINDALKTSEERFLIDQNRVVVFDTFWPQLEIQLNKIRDQPEAKTAPRPEREVLEGVLEILRSQEQHIRKERDEKELARSLNEWFVSNLAETTGPNIGLRMYLAALKSSEKKFSDKARARQRSDRRRKNLRTLSLVRNRR
jgi:hypothetical protein